MRKTSKRKLPLNCAVTALALSCALPALAATQGVSTPLRTVTHQVNAIAKGGGRSAHASAVSLAQLAVSVLAYGRAVRDPMALALAARMWRDANAAPAAGGGAPLSAGALFAEARKLAGNSQTMIDRIDAIAAQQTKGCACGGTRAASGTLGANGKDSYTARFDGGDFAEVGVSAEGGGVVELYVYDRNGNLICAATTGGSEQYCSWTPRWTGAFRVDLVNREPAIRNYVLLTSGG